MDQTGTCSPLLIHLTLVACGKSQDSAYLASVSYAGRYSANNNIQHLWSPMSKELCSIILLSLLEGEEKEPCKQNDLPEAERKQKEAKVGSYLFKWPWQKMQERKNDSYPLCID